MSNVLVLNMGMKSIRSIIFDDEGHKISSKSLPLTSAISDRKVEQNPKEWWTKAVSVMKTSLREASVRHLDAITVTTSASCLVCMDDAGTAQGSAIMVSDKRAENEARYIAQIPEFAEVRRAAGLNMSASLMLPKILWVRQHCPDIFCRTQWFLSPNDYLIYHLCGRVVTDELNAAKYHYDIEAETYPCRLLERLGIPIRKLPPVAEIGSRAGQIRSELAEELGVDSEAMVYLSSYDAICSFLGSGVSEDGEASDVSGTVTVFRALSFNTELKKEAQNLRVYVNPYRAEQAQIIGGSNNLGGGLIEWAKQCYYMREEYPYEVMEKDAGESSVGARGLIFLPYLLGERAPLWNDEARGVFFGLERMHTRKDMTRAIFESTGFIDMDMMKAIREAGTKVCSVRLSGGLARIPLISQIKADILGVDVLVLNEFETTSTGAAMLAFIGLGRFRNLKEAAARFVQIRMIIKPDRENHERYQYVYELYKSTYDVLQPQFAKRMKLLDCIRNDREVSIENL